MSSPIELLVTGACPVAGGPGLHPGGSHGTPQPLCRGPGDQALPPGDVLPPSRRGDPAAGGGDRPLPGSGYPHHQPGDAPLGAELPGKDLRRRGPYRQDGAGQRHQPHPPGNGGKVLQLRRHADGPDPRPAAGPAGGDLPLRPDDAVWNYDARRYSNYLLRSGGTADTSWVMAHTAVLHFCGSAKPWKPRYPYRFGVLYQHYQQLERAGRL